MAKFDFKKALKSVNSKVFKKAQAEASTGGFGTIPSGEVLVFRAGNWRVDESQNGRPQVSADMKVVDGDYAGQIFFYHGGVDEQGLPFTLKDLGRLGVDVSSLDSAEDLGSALEELASGDIVFRGKLVDSKTSDFQNLRIQKMLDGAEYPETTSDASAASGKRGKAAEAAADETGGDADVPFEVGDAVKVGEHEGTIKAIDTDDSTCVIKLASGKSRTVPFDEIEKVEAEEVEAPEASTDFEVGDSVLCGDDQLEGTIKAIDADDGTVKVTMTESKKVKTFGLDQVTKAEDGEAEAESEAIAFEVGDDVSFKQGKKTLTGTVKSLPKSKGGDGFALIRVKGEAEPLSVKISLLSAVTE